MADTQEANDVHHGMTLAAHIADAITIPKTTLGSMTAEHATECMREMIVTAIRKQAEAMRQSAWDREREEKESDNG